MKEIAKKFISIITIFAIIINLMPQIALLNVVYAEGGGQPTYTERIILEVDDDYKITTNSRK